MRGADLRFIHISDLHILAEPDRLQYGVDTGAILRGAVDAINRERPDFVIATGDLAGDESEDAYRRLQALLMPLDPPIHFLLGNHDSRTAFRRVFCPAAPATAEPFYETFEHAGVRFVLLDSTVPGKAEGALPPDRLAWLDGELTAHPGRPTWIFLHHQPLPIYIRWLDRLALADPEPLLSLLGRHPQVRAVGYGHVHQARSWRYGKAHFFSAPALAFQFSSINQEPEVTREAPGFRLVELAAGEARHRLHYLDGRVEPEPCLNATPIYVR